MKKAKEYAMEFQTAQDKDKALSVVLVEMHQEVTTLIEKRGVKSDAGLYAIFNEVDDKFQSFARQVGEGVNPKSFAVIIKRFHWQAYVSWIRFFPGRAR